MAFRGNKVGWSTEGKLISASATNPRPQDAVHLQVDFGEEAAEYYTLQFSLTPPRFSGENTADIRGKAEIRWSVEGNFVRRIISVWNGASISGVGQGVSIKITDDTYNPDGAATSFEYRASVQVTKGTRPTLGGGQPPLYMPLLSAFVGGVAQAADFNWLVPAATDLEFSVPEDSGVNSIYIATRGISTVPVDPEQIQLTMFANGIEVWYGTLRNCNRFETLPPGVTFIRVRNATANDMRFTVMWGVEG